MASGQLVRLNINQSQRSTLAEHSYLVQQSFVLSVLWQWDYQSNLKMKVQYIMQRCN